MSGFNMPPGVSPNDIPGNGDSDMTFSDWLEQYLAARATLQECRATLQECRVAHGGTWAEATCLMTEATCLMTEAAEAMDALIRGELK